MLAARAIVATRFMVQYILKFVLDFTQSRPYYYDSEFIIVVRTISTLYTYLVDTFEDESSSRHTEVEGIR